MNILDEICARKREHVRNMRRVASLQSIEQHARRMPAPRGFKAAIDARISSGRAALIAEIKKASPSKGIIRNDFAPATHAHDYETGGAACLSVLTDTPYFQGEDRHVIQAKNACTLPVLRKDFIVDAYQIAESRALGADCILLIMAALNVHEAHALETLAHDYGMDVLVEVHTRSELESALSQLKTTLVGINNRDLRTFNVDLAFAESLAPIIPAHYTVVCESGIHAHTDIARMQLAGVHSFLVGESLMRQDNVAEATRHLLGGV
jgi:indole-3-glycerol phosphate synthase